MATYSIKKMKDVIRDFYRHEAALQKIKDSIDAADIDEYTVSGKHFLLDMKNYHETIIRFQREYIGKVIAAEAELYQCGESGLEGIDDD